MTDTKERGLWIGLAFPNRFAFGRHPLHAMMSEDAHVTLAHLGRTNNASAVGTVFSTLRSLDYSKFFPLGAELTGIGVFWRRYGQTNVALVNSAALFELRTLICKNLDDRAIHYDKRYGFIPHVTLTEAPRPDVKGYPESFSFECLELVWGDERMRLS